MLQQHCDDLNRRPAFYAMGWFYFVGTRNGRQEVQRRDSTPPIIRQ